MAFTVDKPSPAKLTEATEFAPDSIVTGVRTKRGRAVRPISQKTGPVTKRRAPIISDSGSVRVLERYTGLVEAVENEIAFLTLHSNDEYYELELPVSTFTAGFVPEAETSVIVQRIQRVDHTIVWHVKPAPERNIDPRTIKKYQDELAEIFDGSRL